MQEYDVSQRKGSQAVRRGWLGSSERRSQRISPGGIARFRIRPLSAAVLADPYRAPLGRQSTADLPGIHLPELGTKKQNLRRVVNPQQQDRQRSDRPVYARRFRPAYIPFQQKFAARKEKSARCPRRSTTVKCSTGGAVMAPKKWSGLSQVLSHSVGQKKMPVANAGQRCRCDQRRETNGEGETTIELFVAHTTDSAVWKFVKAP
jgi:hypothetical protein